MEKLETEDHSDKSAPGKPSILRIVCDTLWLAVTTAVLLGVYIVTYLANDPRFGVQNTTGVVSDKYYTQVCLQSSVQTILHDVYLSYSSPDLLGWQSNLLIY